MERVRDPKLYNAPLVVTTRAALAAAGAYEFLAPADNSNGRFLAGVAAHATRAAASSPMLALARARKAPIAGFADPEIEPICFSDGFVIVPSAGAEQMGTTLNYWPETMLFLPPGYGVYLIALAQNDALYASAWMHFDIEQRGR